MSATTDWRELQLPWQPGADEERRFRAILLGALTVFALLAVAIPQLPITELATPQSDPPPALTKITLQKRDLPPAPPKPATVKPKPQPKPQPTPAKKAKQPDPVVVPPPKPRPRPVDPMVQARKAAAAAGVLAFQDDLQALRDSVDVSTLNQTRTSRGVADAARLERAIISSAAATSSGGINTAAASADTGGPALAARETTQVQSTIAGAGKAATTKAPTTQTGGRSDESIRRVMDANKGAIFAIYNRALRKDPLLEGKVVFEMVIAPNGAVTELELVSSGLADEALTRKILARINLIQFGDEDVTATRVNYSFDFLPYT